MTEGMNNNNNNNNNNDARRDGMEEGKGME